MFSYLNIYLFEVLVILFIGKVYNLFNTSLTKSRFDIFIFLMVVLIAGLRYDTTTDYDNYIRYFLDVTNGKTGRFESGYYYLNLIFVKLEYGYINVFFISSLFSIYAFYKILHKLDIVFYGFLFFFLFGIYRDYDNLIRQSISIGIFILSINYAKNGKYVMYILCGIIASLFHASAIIIYIPYYLLIVIFKKYDFTFVSWLIIIITSYLGYIFGVFTGLSKYLLELMPQYSHYSTHAKFGVTADISSGLGILFWVLIALFIAYFKKITSKDGIVYSNLAITSIVLFLIVNDYIILERIVKYLYVFRVIAISLILQKINSQTIKGTTIIVCLIFFIKTTIGYYGVNSYKTIFSDQRKNWEVYDRHRVKDKFSSTSNRNEYKKLK